MLWLGRAAEHDCVALGLAFGDKGNFGVPVRESPVDSGRVPGMEDSFRCCGQRVALRAGEWGTGVVAERLDELPSGRRCRSLTPATL